MGFGVWVMEIPVPGFVGAGPEIFWKSFLENILAREKILENKSVNLRT